MKKIVSTMFKCGAICASINVAWGEGGEVSAIPPKPLSTWEGELSEEVVSQILKSPAKLIYEGSVSDVYACERYALKVPKFKTISEKKQCQILMERLKHLISIGELTESEKYFCRECNVFFTKYFGTYTFLGQEVCFFEKIDGIDYVDTSYVGITGRTCRLLAQAAAGIAVMHEAGCINSDMKLDNMMVTKNQCVEIIKLIDYGAIIDLTNISSKTGGFFTPLYLPPEAKKILKDKSRKISPAFNVYQLGVTALCTLNPTFFENKVIKTWDEKIKTLKERTRLKEESELLDYISNSALENIANSLLSDIDLCFMQDKPEETRFIGQFLKDCLAVNPEDRISAAQAAEILQVFSSYLEAKEEMEAKMLVSTQGVVTRKIAGGETKVGTETTMEPRKKLPKTLELGLICPKYEEVKAMAIKDCPKSIPVILRAMLFSGDPKRKNQAQKAIIGLVENGDSSYADTPSYGAALLLKDLDRFYNWGHKHPEALKQLKTRTYILGSEHTSDKDMPISESHHMFLNPSATPMSETEDYPSPETDLSLGTPDGTTSGSRPVATEN